MKHKIKSAKVRGTIAFMRHGKAPAAAARAVENKISGTKRTESSRRNPGEIKRKMKKNK